MGLFNTVKVNREFKLPLPADLGELTLEEIYSENFQTKDLEYGMNYYTIHPDGSLTEEIYSYGEGEEGAKLKEVKPVNKPQLVTFYNSFQKDSNDYWIEFQYLYDTEPKINLIQFEIKSNAERKKIETERNEERRGREELLNKWYVQPYNWYARLIRFCFRKYRWLMQKLPDAWQIERFLTPL